MMQRVCPQCEAPNDAHGDVCEQCGFPLEPVTEPESRPPTPTPLPVDPGQSQAAASPVAPTQEAMPVEGAVKPPAQTPVSSQRRPLESRPTELERPIDPAIHAVPSKPVEVASRTGHDAWEQNFEELAEHTSQIWRDTEAIFAAELGPAETPSPQPSLGPTWKLVVVEGFSVGKEYLIYKDTMVVGRRDSEQGMFPDIDLEDQDDGFISRRHAVLRRIDERLVIEDLGGENGTQIDMKAIEPHQLVQLAVGQVVRLGRVGLLVQAWAPVTGGRSQ